MSGVLRRVGAAITVTVGIGLSGCSGEAPLTAALKRGDTKVCVNPTIQATVVRLIDDERDEAIGEKLSSISEVEFREALTYRVAPETVTLAAFDEETKRMHCEGMVRFTSANEVFEQPVFFSVIPTADGRDQRITLQNAGDFDSVFAPEVEAFIEALETQHERERMENWVDPAIRWNNAWKED